MWDGREPSLFQQSIDATLGHAQANAAPSAAQQQQIVAFEGCTTPNNPGPCANIPAGAGVFTAQLYNADAGYLAADGATGGPVTLAHQLASFFIGVNDPLGLNPSGALFSPVIFTEYGAWANLSGSGEASAARRAIARGEQVFNSVPINITGVGGLNDALNQPNIPGFCGTCHDTPNSGNHSVKAPLNIGVANAGAPAPGLTSWVAGLHGAAPSRSPGGQTFQRPISPAMISGKCADIGRSRGRSCAVWRRARLQRLGRQPAGRHRVLRPTLQHWSHRPAEERSRCL
jgi:hypothetical protein